MWPKTLFYDKLFVWWSYVSLRVSLHSVQDVWQFSAPLVSYSDQYGYSRVFTICN